MHDLKSNPNRGSSGTRNLPASYRNDAERDVTI